CCPVRRHARDTTIPPLSLHDALPICHHPGALQLSHEHVQHITQTCSGIADTVGEVQPAVFSFDRCRALSIFNFFDGVVFLTVDRSEEHTSELQSRENLVCRLLLEKKK